MVSSLKNMFFWLLLAMVCDTSASWSWTLVPPSMAGASRVSGHGAATNLHHDRVLVFGGLTGNAGSPCTDQLWTFCSSSSAWTCLDTTTTVGPGPRMYSAAAVLHDRLYVLGGWDPGAPKSGGTFLDDVWCLDVWSPQQQKQQPAWTKSQQTLPCGPVSRHAACTVGGTMIVVHTFRGIVVLTGKGNTEKDKEEGNFHLREQPTTGEAPDGFSMCAMAPLTDTSLLVFGGSTKTQQLSADAYVLDTSTWTWTKLDCSSSDGLVPSPRASPCAAQIRDNQCVVFGGASLGTDGYQGGAGLQAQGDAWILTVDGAKGTWQRVESTSDTTGPKPRLAATLCPWKDDGFLLQGGWDPAGETFADTWILQP